MTDDAIPMVDVIYALKAADKGWPSSMPYVTADAIASGGFNGYLDHEGQLTESGRAFLGKFGFLVREAAQ